MNFCTTVRAATVGDDAALLQSIGRAWHRPSAWHAFAVAAFESANGLPYYDRLAHACADADHACAALLRRDRADYDAVSFAEPWPDEALDAYIARVEAIDDGDYDGGAL